MSTAVSTMRRLRGVFIIALLFLIAGAAAGAWYWRTGQWFETTENAYLTGNLVSVSSQVSGTVVRIAVEENEHAAAGAEMLHLGEGDALLALQLRREELALAVQEVGATRARLAGARAALALREVTHRNAEDEYQRRKMLSTRRMVSEEEREASRTHAEETAGELQTARHVVAEMTIRAGSGAVAAHPAVLQAAARLRTAYRNWRKTRVIAPVAGEVARRRVQVGQYVEAGTPLFTLAQRDSAWVEANFKENQLRNMRPGQPVTLISDLYGDAVELHGRVASIGSGTGAIFSLLPPQNATGNWIKIVQRVPVRIELDRADDGERPLPFGASLRVRVDTHDRSAPRLVQATRSGTLAEANVYAFQNEGAQAMVDEIVNANLVAP